MAKVTKVAVVGDVHLADSSPRSWKADYFSTVLSELEFICKENDIVLFLGDVFHKPTLSNLGELRLIKLLAPFAGKVFSIVGNHDIYNMSLDSMPRTALQKFSELGLIRIFESMTIGGVFFEGLPMIRNPIIPPAKTNCSVLLGHFFFEQALDPGFSITGADIEKKGHKVILLGHDHEPHPPMKIDGTLLVRPGSLTRNTSHKYNLSRQPTYIRISVDDRGIVGIATLEIPAPIPSEVFNAEAFTAVTSSSVTFLANIKEMLAVFQKSSAKTATMTIKNALTELKAPESVVECIRGVHERNALNFS